MGTTFWLEIVVALGASGRGVDAILLVEETPASYGAPSFSFMDSASGSVVGSLIIESGVGFERFPKGVPSGDTTDSPNVQAPRCLP
jgi:hypothetical protein